MSGSVRRPPSKRLFRQRGQAVSAPGSKVVELSWQLPARLRRPVKQEMARQRQRQRQQQAVVQFARRPLYNDAASSQSSLAPIAPRQARGHQLNTYQLKNPGVRMHLPPYVGAFTRQLTTATPPVRVQRTAATSAPFTRPVRSLRTVPQSGVSGITTRKRVRTTAFPLGERDAPFVWDKRSATNSQKIVTAKPIVQQVPVVRQQVSSEAVVVQPKRRFALPLHFSIWPRETSSADQARLEHTVAIADENSRVVVTQSKKKRRNRVLM